MAPSQPDVPTTEGGGGGGGGGGDGGDGGDGETTGGGGSGAGDGEVEVCVELETGNLQRNITLTAMTIPSLASPDYQGTHNRSFIIQHYAIMQHSVCGVTTDFSPYR